MTQNKNNVGIVYGLDYNTKIARYMPIEYLYAILYGSRKFPIYNRNHFTDLSETRDKDIHGFNIFQIVSNKTPEEIRQEGDECRKIHKESKNLCVWCWTKDVVKIKEEEKCQERYLMWKAYTSGQIGCRIETTVSKLIDALDANYQYKLGNVIYGDRNCKRIETTQSAACWDLFHKNLFYADEQEVRLVVMSPSGEEKIECVKLSQQFITKITISPFIQREIAKMIVNQLQDFEEQRYLEITKVRLADDSSFTGSELSDLLPVPDDRLPAV